MEDGLFVDGFALEDQLLDDLSQFACLSRQTDSTSQKALNVDTLLIKGNQTVTQSNEVTGLIRGDSINELSVTSEINLLSH